MVWEYCYVRPVWDSNRTLVGARVEYVGKDADPQTEMYDTFAEAEAALVEQGWEKTDSLLTISDFELSGTIPEPGPRPTRFKRQVPD